MKSNVACFLAILLFSCFSFSCSKENSDSEIKPITNHQQELQELIDNTWNDFVDGKENYPGGYALKIIAPAGEYYVACGDLSETTEHTHFRAASTTKTYTAAAIMLLHQEGKLNIDHKITANIPGSDQPYLPETENFDIPFKEDITIKLLLQHRAGMWDIINQDIPDTVSEPYAGMRYCDYITDILQQPDHTFTIEETAGIVSKHQLYNSKPTTEFHYSDTGMGLLGLIIERVSGKRFDQFLAENFLKPLNLNNTHFPFLGTDISLPEPYAPSWVFVDGQIIEVPFHNISMHVAEGNMVTTPSDLAHWTKNLYTGKAGINYENVRFYMMDCLPTFESHQNYGLGTVFTPELGYGHNGGHVAFFTVARYNPENDLTVVMYTNIWDFNIMMNDMMAELLQMYSALYQLDDILKNQ